MVAAVEVEPGLVAHHRVEDGRGGGGRTGDEDGH